MSPDLCFKQLYKPIKKLGEGGYGCVYLCHRLSDLTQFAAKVIPDSKCRHKTYCSEGDMLVPNEVILWEPLDHPNIIALHEVFFENGNWILVMDYCPGFVDLFSYSDQHGVLPPSDAAHIIKQVVQTCCYLVTAGVDHRDIKDENILYNPFTKQIKLIDFGSASPLSDLPYTSMQGTDVYVPPEFYTKHSYHALPAAVWAIGCLSYILLNGDCPFNTINDVIEHKVLSWRNPHLGFSERNFTEACLTVDAGSRMSFEDLLDHPLFLRSAI